MPYLHHNFVVAVLNDLFGIQTRGGCSCAGPYGHRLLGIDLDRSHAFEEQITLGCEGIKPGWVRVNINYFLDDEVLDYLIEAVRMVARDGWRLLGEYRFSLASGLWKHRRGPVEPPLRLDDVQWRDDGTMMWPQLATTAPPGAFTDYLAQARRVLAEGARDLDDLGPRARQGASIDELQWFLLPGRCLEGEALVDQPI